MILLMCLVWKLYNEIPTSNREELRKIHQIEYEVLYCSEVGC